MLQRFLRVIVRPELRIDTEKLAGHVMCSQNARARVRKLGTTPSPGAGQHLISFSTFCAIASSSNIC
jgi:hypothetical protein